MSKPTDQLTDKEHAIRERVEAKLGEPPRRYKEPDEWTVEEHIEHRRKPDARFETEEYREYERQVRTAAGLDPSDSEPKELEDMTVDQHLKRIQEAR
jgi:hypothetical protein